MEIIVRKSCPYTREQLVEAANVGFTEKFKIRTRGTMRTMGALRLQINAPWQRDKVAQRNLSWLKDFDNE